MQCYQCGAMVSPNSRRCPNCGAPFDDYTAYQDERDERQGRERDDQGRNASRRSGSGRSSSNNTGNDTPGSGRGERGDNRGRPRPDPLSDPRAPGFLRDVAPSPRRDNSAADDRYRDAGGRGRGTGGAGGDNRSPREYIDNPRGDPRANRDERDRGRAGGGGRPLAPLNPPSPQRRDAGYADYYDDSPSMEMSAEYSAEYSAEFSAEYPDPRGYNQRGYDQRSPAPASRNAERGGWNDNPRDRRERTYQPYQGPPRADSWGQQAPAGGWDTESAEWGTPLSEEYAAYPYQPQGRARGAQAAKASRSASSRRGPIFIFGTLLVVVLIAVVGGFLVGPSLLSRIKNGPAVSDNAPAFVTYTPGPTPTPPANYKEFANTKAFYVLDYPQSWSSSNSTTPIDGQYDYVDQFTRTTPQANFIVEQAGAFSSLTRANIIKAEVQGGESNGRTFAQISSPTATMEIGGEQWVRSDYLVTQQDGSKLHMAIIACHHRQAGYAIVLVSLPDNFSQDSQSAFEPILNTFHFTN